MSAVRSHRTMERMTAVYAYPFRPLRAGEEAATSAAETQLAMSLITGRICIDIQPQKESFGTVAPSPFNRMPSRSLLDQDRSFMALQAHETAVGPLRSVSLAPRLSVSLSWVGRLAPLCR